MELELTFQKSLSKITNKISTLFSPIVHIFVIHNYHINCKNGW